MVSLTASIYAIFFDYSGVLAEEGFINTLQALAREQQLNVNLAEEGMQAVYDSGFVLGQGSETDFWALLRERTGLQGKDDELTRRVLDGFRLRPGILELVRELRRQGFLVGLLSDQRDPSLYDDITRELGLEPQQILFIDDNPDNGRRAESRGWQTILFRDELMLRSELMTRGPLGPDMA